MFDAMERGELTAVYCIGENPVQSEADQHRAIKLLSGLEMLVVQDLFLTKTAELADVVLPASAAWAEGEGTVTNSERRVQRIRKAVEPPDGARDDLAIIFEIADRMGANWGDPAAERVWDEVRSLSPVHAGMSYRAARGAGGIHGRATTRPIPASCSCIAGSGRIPCPAIGCHSSRSSTIRRSTSSATTSRSGSRPGDGSTRTTRVCRPRATPRRCVAASPSTSHPRILETYGLADGERVRVVSRRGQVEAPVRIDPSLRPGLTFMTLHFQDDVATNLLTIDATDPKSGTAEFKATAIRIEKLEEAIPA